MNICWQAVEAIGTWATAIIAAFVLFWQLPKMKKETAATKIEGLRFSIDLMMKISKWKDEVRDGVLNQKEEYPELVGDSLIRIYGTLETIAELIRIGYVPEKLLFFEFADELWDIHAYSKNLQNRTDSQILSIRASFPQADALLKRGAKFSQRSTSKKFKILHKMSK
jgi:hypothetical protein